MSMTFSFTSPISLEETLKNRTVISGTLLVEGRSRNKNYYSLQELENIANSAQGVPLYFGTKLAVDPNTGLLDPNMHANDKPHKVGKILRTIVDKVKKRIKFWAEVVNTVTHPKIAESVKAGWGVSIGGNARRGRWVLDQLGRLVLKVFGVKIDHVQLLSPQTKRGQDEAKVEAIQLQESMLLGNLPKPNILIINRSGYRVKEIRFEN